MCRGLDTFNERWGSEYVMPNRLVEKCAELVTPEEAESLSEHTRALLRYTLAEVGINDLTTQECLQLLGVLGPAHARKLRRLSGRAPVLRLLAVHDVEE